ncbi:MAG: HEAT repeat domain-containing protein [Verrucomicrobiota bacterium]
MDRPSRRWVARKKLVVIALAAVLFWSLTYSALRSPPRPAPLVQGRPLSAWALDLNSPSASARENAAHLIGQLEADAVPTFVALLRTPEPLLARPVRWIGWRLPARLRDRLFRVADPSASAARRIAGAHALRIMGPRAEPALPALARALRADGTTAWHAALALAQLGQPGITALSGALLQISPANCGFACYALRTLGQSASNAVPALGQVLQTREVASAEPAARALTAIGPAAEPALIEALSHPNAGIRACASRALGSMGPLGRGSLPRLLAVTQVDVDANVRAAALQAAAEVDPNNDVLVPVLGQALMAPSRELRLRALGTVGHLPQLPSRLRTQLLWLLRDQAPEVRGSAAGLLGQIGRVEPNEQAQLEELRQDANEWVRKQAEAALGRLTGPADEPAAKRPDP